MTVTDYTALPLLKVSHYTVERCSKHQVLGAETVKSVVKDVTLEVDYF